MPEATMRIVDNDLPASDVVQTADIAADSLAEIVRFASIMQWKIVAIHRYDDVAGHWREEKLPGEVQFGKKDRRLPVHVLLISRETLERAKGENPRIDAEERVLILHARGTSTALDIALSMGLESHTHLFVGELTQSDLTVSRVDIDGMRPVDIVPDVVRHPLARDFSQLLAARRLLRRSLKGSADHGREGAANWIKSLGLQPSAAVAVGEHGAGIRKFTPRECRHESILYIHGGGLVHYDLDIFSPFLSHLAEMLGASIYAIGYRRCPEVAAEAVIDEILERVRSVALTDRVHRIMGDSIGGLLALYAATCALPSHFQEAVLLYPVLSLCRTFPSYEVYGDGYLLDESHMRWFRSLVSARFLREGFDPVAGLKGKLNATRVIVVSAGCDVLADEAVAFSRASGAELIRYDDLPHDFCLYLHRMQSATTAVAGIVDVLT
ncbi:alpha/beta hydrolase [Agrobacterium vitis]|uniref:alpha/beta hydrolase fold domain-containing protein n=1 Tax=Agrobacterium vitis TaxID=373 RepID=UPI00203465AF|nr:alpha/beta hydrolase [Agrobacterium vitis]MCM2442309.1 alpha/beta hydrolase [Agrobacterium vitis]